MRRLDHLIATALLALESEAGFAAVAAMGGLGFIIWLLAVLAR